MIDGATGQSELKYFLIAALSIVKRVRLDNILKQVRISG